MRNTSKCIWVLSLVASIALTGSVPASAVNTKTSLCKSMLLDVKNLDKQGIELFNQYSKDYEKARKTGTTEDNLIQTRTLLELYENDRSIFLRALESRKCFTPTEILNIEASLANEEADAITVKSWIDVMTGIPGKKFFTSYLDLPKYLATPQSWSFCEKKGLKYKKLICKTYEGKLRWVDSSKSTTQSDTPGWPTDFIDGQVNMIEAKKRILKYFEDNSLVAGTNGAASVDFMKRTAYPGLFNFEAEPKLSACKDFAALQDKAGSFKVKYVIADANIKPDPSWVISDATHGELIVNQIFKGQIFSVPVRVEISQGDWSDPGTFSYRHVALINGIVYRFSAC